MEILHGMQDDDDDQKMYEELEEQLEKKKETTDRTGKPPRRSAAIAADKALDGSKSAPLTVSGVNASQGYPTSRPKTFKSALDTKVQKSC